MKRIDIFCASQASTAICMSMDQPSSSSSSAAASASSSSPSTILLGGRAIDRHNPIIRDERRTPRTLPNVAPGTSQSPPINPKPYHLLHKSKKTSAKNKSTTTDQAKKSTKPKDQKTKKISSTPTDNDDGDDKKSSRTAKDIVRKSWAKASDFISPPGSTRYLLSDPVIFDGLQDYDPVLGLVSVDSNSKKSQTLNQDESTASKPSSTARLERPANQVVVLRVSLHCKGCEGKVRKHLSRMEGVTSFNIDFAAKKVTIVGDVTPLGVLASVSKIKNAQFWTSAAAAAAATPTPAAVFASNNSTELRQETAS